MSSGSISNARKYHQGREWDYVFDVEMDGGGPPLKLAMNAEDNPYSVADKFLEEYGLQSEFRDQVGGAGGNDCGVKVVQQSSGGWWVQCLCETDAKLPTMCVVVSGVGYWNVAACLECMPTHVAAWPAHAICSGTSSVHAVLLPLSAHGCLNMWTAAQMYATCEQEQADKCTVLHYPMQIVQFVLQNTGGSSGRPRVDDLPITGGFCDPFTGGSTSSSTPAASAPASRPCMPPPDSSTFDITGGGVDPFTGSRSSASTATRPSAGE